MRSEKIRFQNEDELTLSAQLDLPVTGRPKAYVLFAHCFTCSKNLKSVDNISRSLTQEDMAVFRFDFTGLGKSEGDFSDTNFSTNLSDLVAAYRFLEENYQAPQVIMGHSLGGAAVVHAAAHMEKVKAVVTVAAPSDPVHVKNLISSSEDEIEELGSAEVNIGGRPFRIKKQFIEDLEKQSCADVVGDIDKALLIMHSPQDKVVSIDNAAEIYKNAMHPKSFITLDGSDHLLSRQQDSLYVGQMVAAWCLRYIDPFDHKDVAPEGEVWTRIGSEGFLTEITAGKHHLIADEPEDVGGQDLGPSPYGYLLAALGTCTAMTLRMYADHKNIDLREVKVQLTHDKVHEKDGESVGSSAKIDQIRRSIKLQGDLSESDRKRLIEIASRCPVHKTITNNPEIKTEEA